MANNKNVVFLTGAFVSNQCWEEWIPYFESKGYSASAPSWPFKDASAEILRSRQPDPKLATLTLPQLTDYYANLIQKMPSKPILIGHSFGGLLTQLLLQKDLAVMGIAIHSVPPQGVIPLEFSFYKATWNALGFLTSADETYLMSFKEWQYAFTNGMSLEEQKESYDKLVIPESKRVARGALSRAGHIDFKKAHAPLLIMSGSEDNIIPASTNYSNFKRYRNQDSIVDYKEFRGRNHYVLGLPTWKENADYILDWIQTHEPKR